MATVMSTPLLTCRRLAFGAAAIHPDQISYFNEAACLIREPARIGAAGGTACGPYWLDDSNVDWGGEPEPA